MGGKGFGLPYPLGRISPHNTHCMQLLHKPSRSRGCGLKGALDFDLPRVL